MGLALALAGCRPPAVKVAETPIKIIHEDPGFGREARAGDVVTIDYRVVREDGVELIREEGFRFTLGRGAVIQGIDHGVLGLRVGGERTFDCPPHLHWGRAAYGSNGEIPYNATLRIEVALQGVERGSALASGG